MTTEHSKQPGLPAWKYPGHVERVLDRRRVIYTDGTGRTESDDEFRMRMGRPRYLQTIDRYTRSPHILGQNRPAYSRSYRDAGYRRRVGLEVARDPRQGLRVVALCALLVATLCAWMFWNANFATP